MYCSATTAECCCYCCRCAAAAEVNLVRGVAATAAVLLLRLVEWRAMFLRTEHHRRTKHCKSLSKYQNLKTICCGVPSDLLVSGRRNAIPCQIEPAKRRLTRRSPPRSSAEIQTCFIMYPWQASLPRGQRCEKKHSAAGEQRAKKKNEIIFYIYMYVTAIRVVSTCKVIFLTRKPSRRKIENEMLTR